MNIFIDPEDGKFNGDVDVNEAKITSNPQIPLFTKDILSCVGIGMFEKLESGILKRGLAHIHYSPEVLTKKADNKDDYTMIPTRDEIGNIRQGLDEFVSKFKEPRAVLVFNSFKKNKIGNFENPMANFLLYYPMNKKVIFHFPDNFANKDLSGKIYGDIKTKLYSWEGKYQQTYYKNMGLQASKLVIQHMSEPRKDSKGYLVEYGDSIAIETFSLEDNF